MNDKPIRVLGFAGSLRQKSYNRALLRAAATLLPEKMTLHCFSLNDIPLYNQDVEAAGLPKAVIAFHEELRAADALLIATPEYNYSISGVLKNALDWASRRGLGERAALDGKTAAIVGAGGRSGTLRAQLHLRDILAHNEVYVLRQSLMLARGWTHFDKNLNLTDESSRERLQRLLVALRDWTWQLQK